jgi:predicted nucleic acid-binding protein
LPDLFPLTVYLDSNVLFSASYIASGPFRNLWRMAQVTPVTSLFAVGEVLRHIVLSAQQLRFDELIARTGMVSDADLGFVPQTIQLVEKDRPILAAAIAASVDYLITGDKSHFGHLYGTRVSGVYVISPADFLDQYEDRLAE